MPDNSTPKTIQSLLYDNFSDICETAVSHVASDAEGNDVYVVVIRTNSKIQEIAGEGQQAGLLPIGQPDPLQPVIDRAPKQALSPLGTIGKPDDLDLVLSKQIGGLLQQTNLWDITKDKRHCTGGSGIGPANPSPGIRPRKPKEEPLVPKHWANLAAADEEAFDFGYDLLEVLKSITMAEVCPAANADGVKGLAADPKTDIR